LTIDAPKPDAAWPAQMRGLRRFNGAMGVLHALQAAAILFLANDFSLPVTATYLEGPPVLPPVIRSGSPTYPWHGAWPSSSSSQRSSTY
jgi:hypothetical protein